MIPVFIGRLVRIMEATERAAALHDAIPMLIGMVLLVLIFTNAAIYCVLYMPVGPRIAQWLSQSWLSPWSTQGKPMDGSIPFQNLPFIAKPAARLLVRLSV
jgi:hypothetical protein